MTVWRSTLYHTDFTGLGIEVEVVRDFEGITAVSDDTPAEPLYPVYDQESGMRIGWTKTKGNDVSNESCRLYRQGYFNESNKTIEHFVLRDIL